MKDRCLSSIRRFWTRLEGAVHPDDQQIFDSHPDHSFNLDFPPPAFIGDVDKAPIVVLMSNGGYKHGETEKEFPDERSCEEHRDYLRGLRAALPPRLSSYYTKGPLGEWIKNGSAVLVNAVPYRSPQLSEEKKNQRAAKQLRSLDVHRRWLFDEVLPEAKAGRRLVLVHRNGWWKVPRDKYKGPCVVFSDPAKAEPNRPTPDQSKLELAKSWLTDLGPEKE
jgi:hypothetical protein